MANPNRIKPCRWDDQSWLAELSMLLARRSGLGIGADVADMCLDDLRAVYRFLVRLEKQTEACNEE
jgi:hypothetical protein